MRILYYSSSPECTTGYGNVAREVIRRLKEAGHFVRVGTKHWMTEFRTMGDGTEIFEGTDIGIINQMVEQEGFDWLISYFDIWLLDGKRRFPKDKWLAIVPIDTELVQQGILRVAADAGMLAACARHGERELRAAGLEPWYMPLGVRCDHFYPKSEGRSAWRAEFGLTDENFVVGSVGLNYGDDRKGFIPLMRAFKSLHERHPGARLYLHTLANERRQASNALPYFDIAQDMGIGDWLIWSNQLATQLGRIDTEWLTDSYCGIDVFCLPTKGEGFGLPIIEAQACGTPVVTTATTTGPELTSPSGGWLIPTTEDDLRWLPGGGWRHEVRPAAILARLEEAWEAWSGGNGDWDERKTKARTFAERYSWDAVWPTYWEPVIAEMERRLER